MRVAVIPARGGSKRIPRKNIREFCGKPMIVWSIEAARESGCFDRIIVSTDDTEIGRVAEVPFIRPAELCDDFTTTTPVLAHAVKWFTDEGAKLSYVCCIYATAPFISPEDIRVGLKRLEASACHYAFSVTRYGFPIQRALRIRDDGRAEMFSPEYFSSRSQDLEDAYHDAGQFYWGTSEAWTSEKPIFSQESIPVVLPRHRVQDIDTPDDWRRAELMFQALQKA
jgi:pseudaminic acid cytidylyltransferase